jgi:hypothetical protein
VACSAQWPYLALQLGQHRLQDLRVALHHGTDGLELRVVAQKVQDAAAALAAARALGTRV